jgi:uncharacterized protein YqjF (DUF2071 family)
MSGDLTTRQFKRDLNMRNLPSAIPLFLADWDSVIMLHLEVSPDELQRETPHRIDTFEGRAFLTLVLFTMHRMRPVWGGRWTEWLLKPIADHEFLNVRIYVRVDDVPGIHFLAEWLPNRISVCLGPRSFSLPYRLGVHSTRHEPELHRFSGMVRDVASGRCLRYSATSEAAATPRCAEACSIEEFLWERYAAFNHGGRRPLRFDVRHPPWRMLNLQARLKDRSLLTHYWPCLGDAPLISSHYSCGFKDVRMSVPRRISERMTTGVIESG